MHKKMTLKLIYISLLLVLFTSCVSKKKYTTLNQQHQQSLNDKVTLEDVLIEKIAIEGYSSATNGEYTVTLDVALTTELRQEGMARELIRAIQEYRKNLNLPINMRVDIAVCADEELKVVVEKFKFLLQENVLMRNLFLKDQLIDGAEINVGKNTAFIQLTPIETV